MNPAPPRVYSRRLDPREHPDYGRRAVQPPTWERFGGAPQFTCLRTFEVKDDLIVGFAEEIELNTVTHGLGTVVWPSYPVLFAKNLGALADEIARRGLYLFDIWGYVPGSGPGGFWRQFEVPPSQLALLEEKLGDRWLGTDIGEQDGRYINGYASQMTPASASRRDQHLHFQRHFERMGDDLGHRHATLVSLNFGHYFLKEGTYTLIGAETGQALPNNQVYYAFIRGAGKQYGVPWFGNASVWNRWGFKRYAAPGTADGFPYGPTKGTSLSLLRRLLYTHLLYDSALAGFEAGWIEDGRLTPIGAIQQAAVRWRAAQGFLGVLHTPVALLLDFHSGWSFPRHLYTERTYRVWGNLPYEQGDHFTDAVLDLLYPGYQDSSYFHDESGFIAPTPFGDIADCVLSDIEPWLLARYPVVVVAGAISGGRELRDKLEAYVQGGGHLVLTAANLRTLPGGIGGVTATDALREVRIGRGMLTLFVSPYGVVPVDRSGPLVNAVDRPLEKIYRLDDAVRTRLAAIFQAQQLFAVEGEGLSVVTCRQSPGHYTVGLANNTWRETPFRVVSRIGRVTAFRELPISDGAESAVGYLPEGVSPAALGRDGSATVAGGSMRIFAVTVAEETVTETPHHVAPPRPVGRFLTLRHLRSIKEEILARPTFFEHCDGVVVDWRYFSDRETSVLEREAAWLKRQRLRVTVDASSGTDSYPTLRLIDNQTGDFERSLAELDALMEKMGATGAGDLILSLHRAPENNVTAEQAEAAFDRTLADLADRAGRRNVRLHVRATWEKSTRSTASLVAGVQRIGHPNLKVALSSSVLVAEGADIASIAAMARGVVGMWLLAGMERDAGGYPWNVHQPLHQSAGESVPQLRQCLAAAGDLPVVLDALHRDFDEEYEDLRWVETRG